MSPKEDRISSRIAVVILAGGEGARIGGRKPFKRLASERLIDRALRKARSWSNLVAVSVRELEQVQPLDADLIKDDPRIVGPLAGLESALAFARANRCELVLAIPADMPFLPADLLKRLEAGIGSSVCALGNSGGRLHPICGLWRTAALREVQPYVVTGRRSLKGFAETVGFVAVDWATEPIDPFFNINTADDFLRAELLEGKHGLRGQAPADRD
jgi:molybdopterin-guanine dinucleotide biosynthesis protein A